MGPDEILGHYEALVRRYHRTLDLVSDRALAAFPRLLGDALAYARCVEAVGPEGVVLDVGSGVGLPAVPMAAALPHRRVVMVERRRRRATFLKMAVAQLGLENAWVIEGDVRRLRADDPSLGDADPDAASGAATAARGVGVVTAQAVSSFADLYGMTCHLHRARVVLVSRKGPSWHGEVEQLAIAVGRAPAVVAEVALRDSGSLVAVEVRGGLPCPPSG